MAIMESVSLSCAVFALTQGYYGQKTSIFSSSLLKDIEK